MVPKKVSSRLLCNESSESKFEAKRVSRTVKHKNDREKSLSTVSKAESKSSEAQYVSIDYLLKNQMAKMALP